MSIRSITTFYVSSCDGRPQDSNSDFTVALQSRQGRIKKFTIEYLMIPKTWYNVRNGRNQLRITDVVSTETIILDNGNYTGTRLATALTTKWNALPGRAQGVIVLFVLDGANAGKFRIIDQAGNIDILGGDPLTTIQTLIGFDTNTGLVAIATSNNISDLSGGVYFIDVESRLLTAHGTHAQTTGLNRVGLIARVPVNEGNFGDIVKYVPTIIKFFDFDPTETLGAIDIILREPDGTIVDLQLGNDSVSFNMALVFYKI